MLKIGTLRALRWGYGAILSLVLLFSLAPQAAERVQILSRDPASFKVIGTININREWMVDALEGGEYDLVAELIGEEGAKLGADAVVLLNQRGKIIRPKQLQAVAGDREAAVDRVAKIHVIAAVDVIDS